MSPLKNLLSQKGVSLLKPSRHDCFFALFALWGRIISFLVHLFFIGFPPMSAIWVKIIFTTNPHARLARGGAPAKKQACAAQACFFTYSSVFTIAIESSSRALSSVGAGHIDIGSDAFCTFGKAITSRISSIPRRSITSLSRPNARPP